MPLIAPAYTTINPSMMLPEILLPYSQASGAFDLLPNEEPRVILGEGDLAIYIRRLELRTRMSVGQAAYNQLPSVDIITSQISTPTYLQRVRNEYDHHDTAAAGRNGFSLVEATLDQFCDMAAPREITVPLAGGAVDTMSELRITSGFPFRPECITVLSAAPQ